MTTITSQKNSLSTTFKKPIVAKDIAYSDTIQSYMDTRGGMFKVVAAVKLSFNWLAYAFNTVKFAPAIRYFESVGKVSNLSNVVSSSTALVDSISKGDSKKIAGNTYKLSESSYGTYKLGSAVKLYKIAPWTKVLGGVFGFASLGFSLIGIKDSHNKYYKQSEQAKDSIKILNSAVDFSAAVKETEKYLDARDTMFQEQIKLVGAVVWAIFSAIAVLSFFAVVSIPAPVSLSLATVALVGSIAAHFVNKHSFKNMRRAGYLKAFEA